MSRLRASSVRVNTVSKILKNLLPRDRTPDTFCRSALGTRALTPADRRGHFEALTHQRWSKPEPQCSPSTLGQIPVSAPSPLCSRVVYTDTELRQGIQRLLYAKVNSSEWEIERHWQVCLCHGAIWFSCLRAWSLWCSESSQTHLCTTNLIVLLFGMLCEPSQL